MKIHVARQPIFDDRLSVYGYELLYRMHEGDMHYSSGNDGTEASSRVILDSFFGLGIEKFTGRRKAFVNFNEDLLDSEVATLFPPDKLVVEVLETVDPNPEIVQKCAYLRAQGYEIALDDFIISHTPNPLVEVADIIKLDFVCTPVYVMEAFINSAPLSLRFLAEKIEDRSTYLKARELGFDYYQGFFLNRPETFTSTDLSPLKANYINLMRYLNTKTFEMDKVENIIRQDVALSFKLLQLVNSVAFGMRFRIRSVHHALVILGQDEARKWITLLSMTGISEEHNEELLRQSLIRAKFSEYLAQHLYGMNHELCDTLFMLGLFSLLDAIVLQSFTDIFSKIDSVHEDIYDALVNNKGPFVPFLRMSEAYEAGQMQEAIDQAETMGISSNEVADAYQNALFWCIGIFG